eukprot:NODE_150_length_2103_cov_81.247976_g126_i0.p1 GENE.NODE_150_length_2103_cov_81.247976_g126_i0~~NODE_150_length_2103_cov_81.247976_g126_i0.p1  ORF type:complete len:695 (+),score=130.23 NODE_150_length_2103_cov_81.247976_g126_i0:94-2085(+)
MDEDTAILLESRVMWKPTDASQTQMTQFIQYVNQKHQLAIENYHQLWEWSCANISEFWADVWQLTNIIHSQPYEMVVDESKPMQSIPEWFPGVRMNYAENLLWADDDGKALIFSGEGHPETSVTYRELKHMVAQVAASLRLMGIKVGDRVGGYISNCIEAVVAMLAASSLGAIWSSTSPDFGTMGVLERFNQIKPKVVFSVNAVVYNGKKHTHLEKLKQVIDNLEGVEKVVVIHFVADQSCDLSDIKNGVTWNDFIAAGNSQGTPELEFEQLPFSHPGAILFSSGTTGQPKCIVHSCGGPLIQHKKEHIIHGNMTRKDIVFQYTTTGWMMWNWLVSVLSVGATAVLFDGSPFKPDPLHLWSLMDKLGVTIFGTSAKYIAALEEAGVVPSQHFELKELRAIFSTGSPLKPESFDYVYSKIKPDLLLGSITGGTDIVSLFAGHNTNLPVYRGELQCRTLGMKVECWNEQGESLLGARGDLVCTKPFPCMPVFFWNDNDGAKYRKAYFSQFEGVWYHGDFILINPKTGGVIMLGRSDGTLNPGGVRIGTAEIYNLIEKYPEVADALVVGQKFKDDERVVLFLKMAPGNAVTPELVKKIKTHIRTDLSPRHVPYAILPTQAIPYTINGKKVEVAVKRILSGEKIQASGAIANPDSLNLYYNIPELQN